jgi:predicted lipoprotein with Yx(FWY)xxD motif
MNLRRVSMRTHGNIMTMMLALVATSLLFVAVVAAATVEVRTKDGVGSYLTDEKGMTLYLFKKDAPGKSACAGPCVDKWPLFAAESPAVAQGLAAANFGTITRDDGRKQSTYKGLPLYYFFKDLKAGDTTGQGVNNVWFVVAP